MHPIFRRIGFIARNQSDNWVKRLRRRVETSLVSCPKLQRFWRNSEMSPLLQSQKPQFKIPCVFCRNFNISKRYDRSKNKAIELPEVNFSEDGESRYLHLGTPWIQGAMKIKEPFELDLEYIQRMMVGLLFLKSASVSGRHAMQLGLGAASLTKFCYKKLRWTCTAIELNPGVLHACRGWFKLPEDGPRMRVIIADAAQEIQSDEWQGTVDFCMSIFTITKRLRRCLTVWRFIKIAALC